MADVPITGLTALVTVDRADLVAVVDDVAGTPITKKATVADLGAATNPAVVCRLSKSSNHTCHGTPGTYNTLSWQAADADTHALWSAGDPTKIIIPAGYDGAYSFSAKIGHAQGSDRLVGMEIRKNGAGSGITYAEYRGLAGTTMATVPDDCVAGDYYTVHAQSGTASQALISYMMSFSAIRVGG